MTAQVSPVAVAVAMVLCLGQGVGGKRAAESVEQRWSLRGSKFPVPKCPCGGGVPIQSGRALRLLRTCPWGWARGWEGSSQLLPVCEGPQPCPASEHHWTP